MKTIILYLLNLCVAISAVAHTVVEKAFTCPIDGKVFTQLVDASGTQFGARLDFKPLGAIVAPWKIPQCPKCKFVLYEETFDKATIQKLKAYILSNDYRIAAASNSSYYCLALIREYLRAGSLEVGEAYLQASWQVEDNLQKCNEYLRCAHKNFSTGLKALKPTDKQFVCAALLCGELERRLGQFEAAAKRFDELKTMAAFKDVRTQTIIDRQRYFISKRDTAPHPIDDGQKPRVE